MLKEWLKAGFIFEGSLHETKKGAAQGGIISPCIAGLALNGLGSRLEKKIKPVHYVKGKTVYSKIHTIAYADDFVVTGKSCELLEEQILPEIRGFLEERGLELSLEKTKITHISKGFDFLGQDIRKYKKKVLIKPSKGNVKNLLERIREKYFHREGNRNWIFEATTGNEKTVRLLRASDTRIIRHKKKQNHTPKNGKAISRNERGSGCLKECQEEKH